MSDFPRWNSKEATENIREMAKSKGLTLSYKRHAVERMKERGLIVSDVLHVLKSGFVHEEAQPARKAGSFKYAMENKTPNSGNRQVRVIVVPDKPGCELKVITVMWIDEKETVAGSIVGDKE